MIDSRSDHTACRGKKESPDHYPIERREGEIERLHIQGAAIEFDAGVVLDRIGVTPGWRCLDLGCGPGGIGSY